MMPAVLVGLLVAVAAWFVARPLVAAADGGRGGDGSDGVGGAGGGAAPAPARRWTVLVLVATTAAVCAGVLVARAVAPSPTGAGAPAERTGAVEAPSARATADPSASAEAAAGQLTDEQLAAVSSALTRVRARPRDVAAHLDLARAYAGADQAQLSAVEYLAVLRLDEANAEAGSALALVALAAGKPTEGKRLVDAVLAAHPRYPDALYTRGLIYLMGLHRAAPGIKDLRAYLRAAPYGSHRPAVETLLAMVSDGRTP